MHGVNAEENKKEEKILTLDQRLQEQWSSFKLTCSEKHGHVNMLTDFLSAMYRLRFCQTLNMVQIVDPSAGQ